MLTSATRWVQVPGAYIEFAERAVLPEHRLVKEQDIQEWMRRDGFEAGNADKIFESTSLAAAAAGEGDVA